MRILKGKGGGGASVSPYVNFNGFLFIWLYRLDMTCINILIWFIIACLHSIGSVQHLFLNHIPSLHGATAPANSENLIRISNIASRH